MAQSDNGANLESRLYEYCKRFGLTVDQGEYEDFDQLTQELAVTPDELRPVIERGLAQKKLAYKWWKGEQRWRRNRTRYTPPMARFKRM